MRLFDDVVDDVKDVVEDTTGVDFGGGDDSSSSSDSSGGSSSSPDDSSSSSPSSSTGSSSSSPPASFPDSGSSSPSASFPSDSSGSSSSGSTSSGGGSSSSDVPASFPSDTGGSSGGSSSTDTDSGGGDSSSSTTIDTTGDSEPDASIPASTKPSSTNNAIDTTGDGRPDASIPEKQEKPQNNQRNKENNFLKKLDKAKTGFDASSDNDNIQGRFNAGEILRGNTSLQQSKGLPDDPKAQKQLEKVLGTNQKGFNTRPELNKQLKSNEKLLLSKKRLKEQKNKVLNSEEGTKFVINTGRNSSNPETVSKEEAVAKIENRIEGVNKLQDAQEVTLSNFLDAQEKVIDQKTQTTFSQAQEAADTTFDAITQTVTGDERASNTGVKASRDIFQLGEKAGSDVRTTLSTQGVSFNSGNPLTPEQNIVEGFAQSRNFIRSSKDLEFDKSELTNFVATASPLTQTEAEEKTFRDLAAGTAQETTEGVGILVGTAPALETVRENEVSLIEAVAGGAEKQAQTFSRNPESSFTEEIGGELGLAGIGAATSPVITSTTPDVSTGSLTNFVSDTAEAAKNFQLKTRKGSAAIDTEKGTPDFVNDVGPKFNPDTTGKNIGTEDILDLDLDKDSTSTSTQSTSSTQTSTQSAETTLTVPESVAAPAGITKNRPESDLLNQIQSEVRSKSNSETLSVADVLSKTESTSVPKVEDVFKVKSESKTESKFRFRSRDIANEQEKNEEDKSLLNLVTGDKKFKFEASLGAELLGTKKLSGKEAEKEIKGAPNPLNLRNPLDDF